MCILDSKTYTNHMLSITSSIFYKGVILVIIRALNVITVNDARAVCIALYTNAIYAINL